MCLDNQEAGSISYPSLFLPTAVHSCFSLNSYSTAARIKKTYRVLFTIRHCYIRCKKDNNVKNTNNTEFTWFTNGVLAMSTEREENQILLCKGNQNTDYNITTSVYTNINNTQES